MPGPCCNVSWRIVPLTPPGLVLESAHVQEREERMQALSTVPSPESDVPTHPVCPHLKQLMRARGSLECAHSAAGSEAGVT